MGKDVRNGSSRRNGVRQPANDRPWSRLEPALLALHEATELDRLWKAIVRLVGLAMPHHHMVAALPFEGLAPMAMKTTVPHNDTEAFWLRLQAADPPIFKVVEKFPGIKISDIDVEMSEEELRDTRFYKEVMVPDGWRHSVGLLFWNGPLLSAHIGICRDEDQGRFSDEEKELLLALHPHFDAAIRRVALIARQELVALLLKEALEHPADGVALLDSQGRVVFQNQAANVICAIWERGKGAAAESFRPGETVELPHCVREISQQLLARFLEDFHSKSLKRTKFEIEIPHPYDGAVSARAKVIAPKLRPVQPHVRVEFSRLANHRSGADPLYGLPVYRLSECEHRVALLVARGMRNQDVASELGRSVHTVRAHLREVFSKLGITHRGEIQMSFSEGQPSSGTGKAAAEFQI